MAMNSLSFGLTNALRVCQKTNFLDEEDSKLKANSSFM